MIPFVDLEYQEPGHWIQKDNQDKHCNSQGFNECLFKANAPQTNRLPAEIRYWTTKEMKMHEREIAESISDRERLEAILIIRKGYLSSRKTVKRNQLKLFRS